MLAKTIFEHDYACMGAKKPNREYSLITLCIGQNCTLHKAASLTLSFMYLQKEWDNAKNKTRNHPMLAFLGVDKTKSLSYLLGWYIKILDPHVYLLVDVHTGNDEEDPRTPGSTRQQPTQPEYHGPLVFLKKKIRKSKLKR
jgi:hypothetical protein